MGDLLGPGQGLDYSHNNYEGDSSIGRNDAYLNKGDAHSLNITKFERVYALGGAEDRYTLDKFRSRFEEVQDESVANNPYYFTGAFSTVAVVPAAYNFVINLVCLPPPGFVISRLLTNNLDVQPLYRGAKWLP